MTESSDIAPSQVETGTGPNGPFQDKASFWDRLTTAGRSLGPMLPKRWRPGTAIVPVVRLTGVIGAATPLRPGLSLAGLTRSLDRAFGMRGAKAVALAINSPGGAAAQSHLIFRRIRQLAEEKDIPVIAAVEDVAASGGYMIACAADEIVCDPSSIVGSIGVIGATFGLDKAIERLGIERRIYTAGESKSTLDPFLPEKPEDVARIKAIQQEIHAMFIDVVKTRRGAKLATAPNLFTGEYWTASTALGHGLVDRLGDLRSYLRERFGKDVLLPVVGPERSFLMRRLAGGTADPGGLLPQSFADDLLSAVETRAIWGRYGL